MASFTIQQEGNQIILTTKNIEWLCARTEVSVFNPILFEGYQRQIDENHCLKIVKYLKNSSFLPSAIICACDEFSEDGRLRIVDGQHRVHAFKMLAEIDPERYEIIKSQELPIVVLVGVPLETEIQTFITINKTSKKVDTSLAYVLKNKLSNGDHDMVMSRSEYIAVEVAQLLNEQDSNELWANRILYEGNVKKSNCYISLNAFVRATRILVNTLNQIGTINLTWTSQTKEAEVRDITETIRDIINYIWETVYLRWPELKRATFEEKQILQGSIGYTAITKTIVKLVKEKSVLPSELNRFIGQVVLSFDVPYYEWTKSFSSYSSESGYRIVSETLCNSIKNK